LLIIILTSSDGGNLALPCSGVVPEGYKPLKEGAATVLLHGNDVFYNEAQASIWCLQ
jgi:hypothetical protein